MYLGAGHGEPGDVWRQLRPGAPPGEDAPPEDIVAWVCRRNALVAASPWILGEYMARFQGLIDDWDDPVGFRRLLTDVGDFLQALGEHAQALDSDAEGTLDIGAALRLDETLDLARRIDPAKLLDDDDRLRAILRASLNDLSAVLSRAWHRGVPQVAGPITFAGSALEVGHPDEASVLIGGHLAIEALEEGVPAGGEPFIPDWRERIEARVAGPGHVLLAADDIPDQDLFYEFLAHRYAYEPGLQVFEIALIANGYSPARSMSFDSATGLSFHVVMPDPATGAGKPPVFVFRGTQPDDLNDIRTDLELQIGQAHFDALGDLGLFSMLRGAARDCGGVLPHLTGHSLGGALAQLAAAHEPSLVGRVVTFQAPGLTRRNRARPDKRPAPHPPVRHYIADDDVVHLAGQQHLEGETILVSGLAVGGPDHWAWGCCHTDLLLTGHDMRERLVRCGLAGVWTPHRVCAFARLPSHPSETGSFHEAVRGGLSLTIGFAKALLAGERTPRLVVRRARFLLGEALDQERPDLSRALAEVGGILAASLWRGASGGVRRLRRPASSPVRTAVGSEEDFRAYLDEHVRETMRKRMEHLSDEEMRAAGLGSAASAR